MTYIYDEMSEALIIPENNEVLQQAIRTNSVILNHQEFLSEPILLPNAIAERDCLNYLFNIFEKTRFPGDFALYLPSDNSHILGTAQKEFDYSYMRSLPKGILRPIVNTPNIYFLSTTDSDRELKEFEELQKLYTSTAKPKWISAFSASDKSFIQSPYKFDGKIFGSEDSNPKNLRSQNLFVNLGQKLLEKGHEFEDLKSIFLAIGISKDMIEGLDLEELKRILIER